MSWLLSQDRSSDVNKILKRAHETAASELTLIECDRALHRARAVGQLTERASTERKRILDGVSESWELLHIRGEVIDRARGKFPDEPVRALAAIHLASAMVWVRTGPVTMLSLDERIRRNAQALGLDVAP